MSQEQQHAERVRALFDAARELDVDAREACLRASDAPQAVQTEVAELLRSHAVEDHALDELSDGGLRRRVVTPRAVKGAIDEPGVREQGEALGGEQRRCVLDEGDLHPGSLDDRVAAVGVEGEAPQP